MSNFGSSIFGNTTRPNFFSLNTNTTSAPQQSSIFGTTAQAQQQQPLFGPSTTSQQQQSGGVFGNTQSNNQPTNAFGIKQQLPTTTSSIFQQPQQQQQQQQQQPSLFGNPVNRPTQQNLFGGFNQQQQSGNAGFGTTQAANNVITSFGTLGGSSIFGGQGNQGQQTQNQPQSSMFGGSQLNRIWTDEIAPRQRSVTDQIELVYQKWNPESENSVFHHYLYNTVPVDTAPFFRPHHSEKEEKWEEALAKKPHSGAIPFLVKGFEQLGHRIIMQEQHLQVLRGRMFEINSGLTDLLRRHELEITARTTECKRKHVRLAQKCLGLATKVQILRNRGYALDNMEEELKQKLTLLEKSVMDPALNGRAEEIWARMVNVRDRGRQLEEEYVRAGRSLADRSDTIMPEEFMRMAKEVLEKYNLQITHLAKELEAIQKDYKEWEESRPGANNDRRSSNTNGQNGDEDRRASHINRDIRGFHPIREKGTEDRERENDEKKWEFNQTLRGDANGFAFARWS